MKIRDFLKNDDFDVNTNVKIFDGTDKTWEEAELLYRGFGSSTDVPEEILDMDIKYITTDGDCIVIEGKCDKDSKMSQNSKDILFKCLQQKRGYGYAILQVRNGDPYALFSSIKELERMDKKPDIKSYTCVYSSRFNSDYLYGKKIDELTDGDLLEYLYMAFNTDSRPRDYHARSMSVSDVVVLNRNGSVRTYFVDSIGFKKLPDSFLDF